MIQNAIEANLLEAMEPRRLMSSVSGVIYDDANENGRRDAGEAGLANRAVYVDLNYNGFADGRDPIVYSAADGSFKITTPSTLVSLSIGVYDGQDISLPYGAKSRWYSSVNGDLAGQDFGVIQRKFNVGFSFVPDYNGNNVTDPEDLYGLYDFGGSFSGWRDLDGNDTLDRAIGEYPIQSTDHDPFGPPTFSDFVTPGTYRYQIRSSFVGATFSAGKSVTVTVGRADVTAAIRVQGVAPVNVNLFEDDNGNGVYDAGDSTWSEFDPFYEVHAIFFDANNDGIRQDGEAVISSSHYRGDSPTIMRIGTYRIAGLLPGESLSTSPTIVVVPYTDGGRIDVGLRNAVTIKVYTGVYEDANRNGQQDTDEHLVEGQTVFADYDNDGVLDADEPKLVTSLLGSNELYTQARPFTMRLITTPGHHQTAPAGNGTIAVTVGQDNQVIGGYFGVYTDPVPATVSGTLYRDSNANGTRDASETALISVLYSNDYYSYGSYRVYADLNDDAHLDANEPSAVVDPLTGRYALSGTPTTRYKLRVMLNPVGGERVSQPGGFGAFPSYTITPGSGPSTFDFGVTRQIVTLLVRAFRDNNGNGIPDYPSEERIGTPWVDLNRDGRRQAEEPLFSIHTADGSAPLPSLTIFDSINAPAGTHRVAIDLNNDGVADDFKDVSGVYGDNYKEILFAVTPTPISASVAASTYLDTNNNGRRDSIEAGLAGQTLFADYNYNGVLDAGEPSAITDATGSVTLNVAQKPFALRPILSSGNTASGTNVQYFNWTGSGFQKSGDSFGVVGSNPGNPAAVFEGKVYVDLNNNGTIDNGNESGLAGQTAFADYDYDGILDADEPSGVTDAIGTFRFEAQLRPFALRLKTSSGYQPVTVNNAGGPRYVEVRNGALYTYSTLLLAKPTA